MTSSNLIWIVLFLPLAGSVFQALLGKKLGKKALGFAAVTPIAVSFLIGVFLTIQLAGLPAASRSVTVELYDWISLESLRIPFEALVDPLSMTMVLIITGIGALIHLYATAYMAEDSDYSRFFTYLNLFVAAMLILVLGNNLALMFIGWEGVGLCSYLLIGHWYRDVNNAKAANKAFIVNRVGDWGLTLGMFMLVTFMVANLDKLGNPSDRRWLSYDVILPNAVTLFQDNPAIATTIALLLFVGACGKSAQFPLYFWLPDAMAGPTPVSALIHAATMVTAGVFLLNRMHIFYVLSPTASAVVVSVGAFTALFAAVVAFGQTDIKKVLAYSTVSQLGFMFIACGAGAYWVGMFHVTTHAFFKALLFLGSGAVIYAMAHNQDIRNYGKLLKYLPITGWTMIIGWLAISGVYGLAGFYSKEGILGAALAGNHAVADSLNLGVIAGWTGLFVALLTAGYMTRMTWLTFFSSEERWRAIPAHAHSDHGHGHAGEVHAAHEHSHAHEHGPDTHGFFFSDDELHAHDASEHDEHHHELDASHQPKEVPVSMWLPLVVLAIASVIGGFILERNHLFSHWLYPTGVYRLGEVPTHPHGIPLLWLSLAAAGGGILLGILYYRKGLPGKEGWDLTKWRSWRRAAATQFGYDEALVTAGVEGGNEVALATWKWIDVGIIDRIVNGVGQVARMAGRAVAVIQTGYVRVYALMMLIGVTGILGYIVYMLTRVGGAP